MKGKILFLGDGVVDVTVDETLFLFIVGCEPCMSIRIRWMEGFDQRGWAWREQGLG